MQSPTSVVVAVAVVQIVKLPTGARTVVAAPVVAQCQWEARRMVRSSKTRRKNGETLKRLQSARAFSVGPSHGTTCSPP